jgi:hypothetical protein
MNRLAEAAIVLGGGGEGFSAALPSSEEVWAPIFDKSATLALLPLLGLRLLARWLDWRRACVRTIPTTVRTQQQNHAKFSDLAENQVLVPVLL